MSATNLDNDTHIYIWCRECGKLVKHTLMFLTKEQMNGECGCCRSDNCPGDLKQHQKQKLAKYPGQYMNLKCYECDIFTWRKVIQV